MSDPQNLPELLQARLKLGLFNWGKRTLIWTTVLGLLSTQVPPFKVLLIGWIVFSAISLAGLLLGLKLAKHLKTGTTASFPHPTGEPRDVGGNRLEPVDPNEHPERSTRRSSADDEIIEIEAEVLPPK
jgi:hypothetical protein